MALVLCFGASVITFLLSLRDLSVLLKCSATWKVAIGFRNCPTKHIWFLTTIIGSEIPWNGRKVKSFPVPLFALFYKCMYLKYISVCIYIQIPKVSCSVCMMLSIDFGSFHVQHLTCGLFIFRSLVVCLWGCVGTTVGGTWAVRSHLSEVTTLGKNYLFWSPSHLSVLLGYVYTLCRIIFQPSPNVSQWERN